MLYEIVPAERLRIEHLSRRYIRGGQTYARVIMTGVPPVGQFAFYAGAFLKLVVALGVVTMTILFYKEVAMKYAFKAWLNAGKLRHAAGLPLPRLY